MDIFSRALHIGPKPVGPGGIACVIRMYSENIDDFRLVETSYGKYPIWRKVWLIFIALWQAICVLSSSKVDLVHIHSSSHVSFYRKSLFVLLAWCYGKKIVFHIHGGFFVPFYKEHKRYCDFIFSKIQQIIVVSESLKRGLNEAGLNKDLLVCYNPIYQPSPIGETLESRDERVQVLFFGSLNENKGVLSILECCRKYKSYWEDKVHLHIGGVGHLDQDVQRLVADGLSHFVTFHGWVEGEKKVYLQTTADIYLQPSHFESLGIAIIEAMSYETAIVASRRGGIPELVEDGVNGFLIEPDDEDMLYEKLKILIEDKDLRIFMAKQSKEKSRAFFIEDILNDIAKVYRRVLKV